MEHGGIDVHKNESQICLLTEQGEILEPRILTRRDRFAAVLGNRPRARLLIEASTESEWVARCLEELGHEVIVADPNYAPMYATRSRRVKTDRRDAQALMDACRLGAYRPAHRTSNAQRRVRALLVVRDNLVRTRVRQIQVLRALTRREGLRVRSGEAASFGERRSAVELPEWLQGILAPVIAASASGRVLPGAGAARAQLGRPTAQGAGYQGGQRPDALAAGRGGVEHPVLAKGERQAPAGVGGTHRAATRAADRGGGAGTPAGRHPGCDVA